MNEKPRLTFTHMRCSTSYALYKYFTKAYATIQDALTLKQIRILKSEKSYQERLFCHLSQRFEKIHKELMSGLSEEFFTDYWQTLFFKLREVLLPSPSIDFLRNPIISATMVVKGYPPRFSFEFRFLKKVFSEDFLKVVLREDLVGRPLLIRSKYCTSANTIHHLFHLATFLTRKACEPPEIKRVMEWGGGYGNMAKIFLRMWRVYGKNVTYIIVDHPLISCLQWLYLSSVFGEDEVHLVSKARGFREGKINILPTSLVSECGEVDLFISTWGLSESSTFAQKFVASKKFFGAKMLLVAFNTRLPESTMTEEAIGKVFGHSKKIVEPVPYSRHDYYVII